MSEIKDGGPAFPFEGGTNNGYSPDPGMTLRDWFAGQALAGMVSSGAFLDLEGLWTGNGAQPTAEGAYLLADAMLAAREAKS